jgi:hypothetical protein
MSNLINFVNRSEIVIDLQPVLNDISSLIEFNKLHLVIFAYITKVEETKIIEFYNQLSYREKDYDDTFNSNQMLSINTLTNISAKLNENNLIDYDFYVNIICNLLNASTDKRALSLSQENLGVFVKENKNEILISSKAIAEKLGIRYDEFVLIINRKMEQLKKLGDVNIEKINTGLVGRSEKLYYFNCAQVASLLSAYSPRKNSEGEKLKDEIELQIHLKLKEISSVSQLTTEHRLKACKLLIKEEGLNYEGINADDFDTIEELENELINIFNRDKLKIYQDAI